MKKNNFPRVPYGQSVHGQEEIDAVVEVLSTTTQMGAKTKELEDRIAKIFDKEYGIMVNSGSSALYLGVEVLSLKAGSEVITPALTFATTVGSLVKNDLVPSFVDVKENTFCIDETAIESKITKKTSAICAPDLMGNICDWQIIREIADRHDLKIIHDSADTLGAKLNGESTGKYSDFSITSFYGSHIINGAGNGGMILTSDKEFTDRCKLLRSWGRSSSLFEDSESIEKRFAVDLEGIKYDAKFVFEEVGYQLEPSELSSAFALVQLENLDKNLSLRQDNFEELSKFFHKYEEFFVLPKENDSCSTGWLAYPLIVKEDSPFNRTELQVFLENRNIQTRVVFTGNILRQPGFKDIDCRGEANDFVNTDLVMRNGILLACHHGLTTDMKTHLFESLELFLSNI